MKRQHPVGFSVGAVSRCLAGFVLVAALGASASCGESTYRLSTFQFNTNHPMEVVSVFPAVRGEDGTYQRQCESLDGDGNAAVADSLLFSIVLNGTLRDGDSNRDLDDSIRPGDLLKVDPSTRNVVEIGITIVEDDFEVELECLEPYPDPDMQGSAECQGRMASPRNEPERLDYRSHFDLTLRPSTSDKDAMAVAILVDQSGSMRGFITEDEGLEAKPDSPFEGGDFKVRATDPDRHSLSAVKQFASLLNANDRLGVFQFGEAVGDTARIVCDLSPEKDEATRRRECFGINRTVVFGCSSAEIQKGCQLKGTDFMKLQANARGRTPLWSAVEDVYRFMRDEVDAQVRHVIVITDGPDTCHPDSPDFQPVLRRYKNGKYLEFKQDGACSNVSFDELLATLEVDIRDTQGALLPSNQVPVHVSFLQLQAMGYRDRDPRQQEVACRTGGHYLFVNAWDLPRETGSSEPPLGTALRELAVPRLRGMLAGAWTLAVDVPDLATRHLQPGSEMAVAGTIRMQKGQVTPDAQYDLRVGYVDPFDLGNHIPRLDQRVAFRIPCGASDSCDWYPQDECSQVACRAGDAVCAPTHAPEQAACGTGGACCWGGCLTPGDCTTGFDALCNPIPAEDGTACTAGVCCSGTCQASCM